MRSRSFRLSIRRRTGGGARARVAAPMLVTLSLCAVVASAGAAEGPAAREPLATLLAGLLTYTHWPTPANPVRLCVWGRGGDVAGVHAAALSSAQRNVTVQNDIELSTAGQRCDAVYVASSAPIAARRLAQQLVGRPVLLIGEGPRYCAEGGMFCVDSAERPLKFQVNLDAIARSGLRVDPQALRIGRPTGALP